MQKTIYIAGKVTGLNPLAVTVKFAAAQEMLERFGFKVINPVTLVNDPEAAWDDAMAICLAVLPTCDAIYFLPCTIDSPGAQVEMETAIPLGLDLYGDINDFTKQQND